jgi:hypothetical protein
MSEKRAIDLAYEIIWGTRPLKDVHVALGEIIAREQAELIKLRDTKPVTGDAAWFAQYRKNVGAIAKEAALHGRAVGYVGPDGEMELVPQGFPHLDIGGDEQKQAKAAGFGFVEPSAFQKAAENALRHAEAERRCKTPRYELEAVDDKRQAKRGPVKIDEAIRAQTTVSGAWKGHRVVMVDWRKPFSDAYRPKLSRYGVKMKVIDKQHQHGVTWLKCEFPLESGEKVRRWFADDGRLMLSIEDSTTSHAKT